MRSRQLACPLSRDPASHRPPPTPARAQRRGSLWWRCHRRLLADLACAARGVPVRHIMHDGRLEEHRLSPGLRLRDDGLLVYDAGQPPLL